MAELTSTAVATLSTLVTATVFSTTFVSGRVRAERQRTLDRSIKLNDALAEQLESRGAGTPLPLGSTVALGRLDEQVAVLRRALDERFPLVLLALDLLLACAVVALAVVFGDDAGAKVWPVWDADTAGFAVLAFGTAAVAVAGVGAADVLAARRDVRRHYATTPLGRTLLAAQALRRAPRATSERSSARRLRALDRARELAEAAIAAGDAAPAQAWATLAYVELARRRLPGCRPDALLAADRYLEHAIEVGPESAPMWAARAYVAEEWEREDAAVAHWLEAARLFTAGTFTSPLASIAPELAGQVAEAAATAPLAPARPEEERRRATGAAHDALAWGFGPVRPATHARALQALDAGDLRAIPVVLWIAGMAARDPATLAPARQALEAFFARAAEEGADPRAVLRVTALLRDDGAAPREIRDVAAAAFTRTLLAPLERLTQSFADLADVQARTQEELAKLELEPSPEPERPPPAGPPDDDDDVAALLERARRHVEEPDDFAARIEELQAGLRARAQRSEERHAAWSSLQALEAEHEAIVARGRTGRWTPEDVARLPALQEELAAARRDYVEDA